MCCPSVQLTSTSAQLDHLKLLDDPSSFMKFPEPQPVQPSRWSIDQRDKKLPSMVRGVRRSRAHRESDHDATRFGMFLKQHPACIALVEVHLDRTGRRVRDFGHRFAIRTLLDWYREGKNVEQQLVRARFRIPGACRWDQSRSRGGRHSGSGSSPPQKQGRCNASVSISRSTRTRDPPGRSRRELEPT